MLQFSLKTLSGITSHILLLAHNGHRLGLATVLILFSQFSQAQLPELALPSTASNEPTTAKFFAGSSADSGASYGLSFASDQAIDVLTEIQPESAHIGTTGNLYLIIVLADQFFMRVGQDYLLWDGELGSLQAVENKSLDASEPISIVEGVAFGSLGLANTSLSVFLAYDTEASPNELYFSGVPLGLAIEGETPAPVQSSFEFFVQNISTSIIQSNCIVCHSSTGSAANTPLRYVSSNQSDFQQTNHNALLNYINNTVGGQSLILSKPQGIGHGGGIRLAPGSEGIQIWTQYIALLVAESAN